MPRKRIIALLAVLTVAAAVRLANLRWMAAQPASSLQFSWMSSDMATHWEWAGRIVRGDVLTRDAYVPYPQWMQEIAPLETWNRWHGAHTFNKAPLYPYVLAVMRATVGEDYLRIGACHVVIGLLNTALVFLLAERYFDVTTAIVAGLGAALYGPSLLYETLLLRDPLAVTVSLLLLLALSRCTTAAPGRWALAGAAFGLAALGRELVVPFAPFVALWAWQRFGGRRGVLIRSLCAFVLGTAVVLAPLVARNLAVGAPPLALSAIGVEGIIYGHAVDTVHSGFYAPAATRTILTAADGRLMDTIRGTLATYDGDWLRLLRNEATRTAAIFSNLEGSDNVNWYYFVDRSPMLAFMLPYAVVVGLGLVGLVLARGRVRGDDRIVLYYLGVSLAGLQLLPVIGRYRLVVVNVLVIYGAVAAVAIARALGARAWRAALVPAIGVAALSVVSARLLLVPGLAQWCRTNEYMNELSRALDRQDGESIYEVLRSGVECATRHAEGRLLPDAYRSFAASLEPVADVLDRRADLVGVLQRLAGAYPEDAGIAEMVSAARTPSTKSDP